MRTAFAHVTLPTRHVESCRAFFERTLGWTTIPRPNNIGRPAAWLQIGPDQELHLIEVPEFEPSPFEREFGRHVAISLPVREFDGLRARLADQGAELIEAERPTPFARFFFRTPDGYVFEVVAAERAAETDAE